MEKILSAERILLKTLAFDLKVEHPIVSLADKWNSGLKSELYDTRTLNPINSSFISFLFYSFLINDSFLYSFYLYV